MWFPRKPVLCTNCGFFCWYVQHASGEGPYKLQEVSKRTRNRFQAATFSGMEEDPETQESHDLYCLRRQWVLTSGSTIRFDYKTADDVRKPQRCAYYMGYQPGFGPEEHKELKREKETRATVFKATLVGAIIGATAAIVAQLLYFFFASSP